MEKVALISKHLVLTEVEGQSVRYPVPGAILIESGVIKEVVIVEESEVHGLLSKYSDWNPVDYTDYYISPGLIDLNCRKEWESTETLTSQFLSEGYTCIVSEPSHHAQPAPATSLYCDICQVQIINESTSFASIPPSVQALKVYLFPPSPSVKSASNLEHVINAGLSTGLPLMVDACLPDPRMLYMASPLRLESLDQRSKLEVNSGSTVFAAAFPEPTDTISDEGSDSCNSETEDLKKIKTFSLQPSELAAISKLKRSISNEKLFQMSFFETTIQEENENFLKSLDQRAKHDIYSALDVKIREQQQNIEDLCKAERFSYTCSGATRYQGMQGIQGMQVIQSMHSMQGMQGMQGNSINASGKQVPGKASAEAPKKSSSLPSIIFTISSPLAEDDRPVRKRRPAPIEVRSPVRPDFSRDYNFYLANCPDHWETAGIEKTLEVLRPSSKVHFFNLSSATAFNLIRKSRKTFKHITCDVSVPSLYFHSGHIGPGDTRFKNSPPIRNQGNYSLLWDLLKMTCIDCISSGHSFIEPALKLTGTFAQALSGLPVAGLGLKAVWTRLHTSASSAEQLEHYLVRLAKWFSLRPAQVLGFDQVMGKIAKGKRADLVVWRPWDKVVIEHKAYERVSPFIGHKMMGKVFKVYLRGQLAYELGKEKPPLGTVLSR